jgi:HK97 family phage major capsid protein
VDGVEIAVTHTPDDSEILGLYGALAQEYRDGACFIMNDAWMMYLRSMLIATPRAYGNFPDFGGGDYESFMGKPLFTNANWTDMTAGDDVLIISFLNLSESIGWVDRRGLRIFTDPYGDAANGRVRFFPSARFACAVANSDAMAGLDDHA